MIHRVTLEKPKKTLYTEAFTSNILGVVNLWIKTSSPG